VASESAVIALLERLGGAGLNFPPRGEREAIISAWYSILRTDDCPDALLLWAANHWQRCGNRDWPKPMDIVEAIAAERNNRASKAAEERGEIGCFACRWTGTRTVIRHLLMMRGPLHPADVQVNIDRFLSDEPVLHAEVERWVEANPEHAHLRIQTFVARCDCPEGREKQNILPYQEYTRNTPPRQEPSPAWRPTRPVACRQYVTGSQRRYHPDDRVPPTQGVEKPIRFFNAISPEENLGPTEGALVRRNAQDGGSRKARGYLARAGIGRRA
jgi:hypothetical protein